MCLVHGVLADWTSQEMGQVPADNWAPVYGQPKDFWGGALGELSQQGDRVVDKKESSQKPHSVSGQV